MRIICEIHLRKEGKWRGTEHLFTFHLRLFHFFPDLFREQTFTLAPLTKRKHVTVEKIKFYKRLVFFFFSVGFLGPVSAPLSKLDLAIFVIRVKTVFGVDGGWTRPQVFAGAGSTSQSSADGALRHPIPLPGCTAQFWSLGWFWWQLHFIWLFFSSFSECNLLTYRAEKCHGCPEKGREHKGWEVVGAAQIQPISRTNLSQGLCSACLHFKGLQKSSCSKGFSPSDGKASTACEIKE